MNSYIFVGTFSYDKGVDIFLDLARNDPRNAYYLFGFSDFTRDQVDLSELPSNVHQTSGDYRFFDRSIDGVLVLPSRCLESFSRVWLEAASHGVPFLTTKNAVTTDVFDTDQFLVEDWTFWPRDLNIFDYGAIKQSQREWLQRVRKENDRDIRILKEFIYE